jgi:hypothetical protein
LLHRVWSCWTEEWAIGAKHAGVLILPHGQESDSVAYLLAFLQTGHSAENHVYRYFPPPRGWGLYESVENESGQGGRFYERWRWRLRR